MADEERTYVIPLRKEFLKAPKYKRSKKAIKAIREFLTRHLKSNDVRLGKELNLDVWKHGMKNPSSKIKIHAVKKDNIIRANLIDFPIEFPKPKEKKKKEEKKKEIYDEKEKDLVKKGEPEKSTISIKEKPHLENLEEQKEVAEKPKIIRESTQAVRSRKDIKKKPKKKK